MMMAGLLMATGMMAVVVMTSMPIFVAMTADADAGRGALGRRLVAGAVAEVISMAFGSMVAPIVADGAGRASMMMVTFLGGAAGGGVMRGMRGVMAMNASTSPSRAPGR